MDEVAIIGGGIGGLTLALALQAQQVPVRVYESRSASAGPTLGGGMMLSPNSLSLLDSLGVYSRIHALSYPFTRVYFKNGAGETVETFQMGDPAVYRYPALRVFRRDLHQVLATLCAERGIPVEYNAKYASVISESADAGVTFALATGETRWARLLVGADGIHSSLRTHVTSLTPVFGRSYAIGYAVPSSKVRVPPSSSHKEFPQTIIMRAGAFVLAPQMADGGEMMAGSQFPWPGELGEPTREEWAALAADTDKLKALLRNKADYNGCPDIVQSALEEIKDETMYVWPFYMLPRLPTLSSAAKRVVLMGDAAHAIPPTTGQGAGMAIEDAFTLGRIIAAACPPSSRTCKNAAAATWESALAWWETTRQNRLDGLVDLTNRMNRMRLPAEKLAQLSKDELWSDESETNPRQLEWLYAPRVMEEVEAWIKAQSHPYGMENGVKL